MYKHIVVPIDIADNNSVRSVIHVAVNFANVYGSCINFIYVIPDFGMRLIEDYLPRHWFQDQTAKHKMQLKELIAKYIPEEIKTEICVERGTVYDEVINYATKVNADLIMISAVRPQLRDYMLGSNASKIVRHAGISVLVVRD